MNLYKSQKRKLFIAEWKTNANWTPNINIQETIRANSIPEAQIAANEIWIALHESKGKVLEFKLWEIGKLVVDIREYGKRI